jgi:putative integral membrane protein (TIGR02587 family)
MNFSHERTVSESLQEYGRGIAGGLIFALPLLFTMEVWNVSLTIDPAQMLGYLLFTVVLLLLYNRYAGLRSDASYGEMFIDSIEELGLGLILSAIVLWMLGRIGGDDTLYQIVSRVVMQGMTLAIGISVGTAQLGIEDADGDNGMEGDSPEEGSGYDYLGQSAIALCGAVLFAANIAPTEEVGILAREASPGRLAAIMTASLVIGTIVLYFAEFRGSHRHLPKREWPWITREIVTVYAAALAASGLIIYFFGSFPAATPFQFVAGMIVVGFPAMLGASAGRLLLQLHSTNKQSFQ